MRSLPRSLLARYRFVRDLEGSVPPTERQRVERVLATARAFVSGAALLTIYFDPAPERSYPALAREVLLGYALASITVWIILRTQQSISAAFGIALHTIDLLWATLLATLSGGAEGPFQILFVFVQLAAAYRWGLVATLATTAASIVALVAGPLLVAGSVEWYSVVVAALYLTIIAALVGYLAEGEKYRRAELSAVARVMTDVQAAPGFDVILTRTFDHVLRICHANVLLMVAQETASGRAFLWQATAGGAEDDLRGRELPPAERHTYFFPMPATAWATLRPVIGAAEHRWELLALDADGKRLPNATVELPSDLAARHDPQRMMAVTVSMGEGWIAHLLLFDAQRRSVHALRFLQKLATRLGPAIHSGYVRRRMQSRVGGVERTRLAQDLHDGIIQSLIGMQMHIDVLRQHNGDDREHVLQELGRIREMLSDEVAAARELMQQVKPIVFEPDQLPGFIAELVERFQRETGITARFTSRADAIDLPSRTCRELARIVQEALANVRRHSRAQHVAVELASTERQWSLTIENDGEPFDFTGRWSLEQLEAARKGPALIKERVRSIGAGLTVSSDRGRVRLEVSVERQAKYATT